MLLVAPDVGSGVGAGWQDLFAAFADNRKYTFHQPGGRAFAAQWRRCFDVRNDEDGAAPLIVCERNVTRLGQFEPAARDVVDDAMHEALLAGQMNLTVA